MAVRLTKTSGRSPEGWLAMQDSHNLWQARRTVDLNAVKRIDFQVAKLPAFTINDAWIEG